jgi:hypothetical protein
MRSNILTLVKNRSLPVRISSAYALTGSAPELWRVFGPSLRTATSGGALLARMNRYSLARSYSTAVATALQTLTAALPEVRAAEALRLSGHLERSVVELRRAVDVMQSAMGSGHMLTVAASIRYASCHLGVPGILSMLLADTLVRACRLAAALMESGNLEEAIAVLRIPKTSPVSSSSANGRGASNNSNALYLHLGMYPLNHAHITSLGALTRVCTTFPFVTILPINVFSHKFLAASYIYALGGASSRAWAHLQFTGLLPPGGDTNDAGTSAGSGTRDPPSSAAARPDAAELQNSALCLAVTPSFVASVRV